MLKLAMLQGIEEASAQRKLKALREAGLIERYVAHSDDSDTPDWHHRLTQLGREALEGQQ